jgi:hypothetical protein
MNGRPGKPLDVPDAAAGAADTGRPGPSMLQPSAPAESEQTEHGEQRQCEDGANRR